MKHSGKFFFHATYSFCCYFFLKGKRIQRVFFGSEHGKGEADGETGVIDRAVDRAVSSDRLTVRNTDDLHTWCNKELTRRDHPSLRDFFLVPMI